MMEMWGVQVTSKNPDKMGEAMALIRQEINRTQQAVRETYGRLGRCRGGRSDRRRRPHFLEQVLKPDQNDDRDDDRE
jgi:hypothetical protein